jgi:hypothetical protein
MLHDEQNFVAACIRSVTSASTHTIAPTCIKETPCFIMTRSWSLPVQEKLYRGRGEQPEFGDSLRVPCRLKPLSGPSQPHCPLPRSNFFDFQSRYQRPVIVAHGAMSRRPLMPSDVQTSNHLDSNAANGQKLRRIYETLFAKAPTYGARVAESLDYEPVQNNLYFERLRARVGVKRYYGCVYGFHRKQPCAYRL